MNKNPYIEVNTLTWDRENHGLFDYKTNEIQRRSFKVAESSSIYRDHASCYIPKPDIIIGSFPLVTLMKLGDNFQVSLVSEDYNNKMWLVVKEIKDKNSEGFKLNEGDWIKIGRIKLKVKQICLNPNENSHNVLSNFYKPLSFGDVVTGPEENKEGNTCRICLSELSSPTDPLITPCKCSGTMKVVHLNCLKEWLKNKVTSRINEKGMSYYLKDLICELCKTEIPPIITVGVEKIPLITMTYPTTSFIILEEFSPDRYVKYGLHILSLTDKQSGIIGRGHESDIKISDITVSRKHCRIKLIGNEFFVEDKKSKFGTLAKMKKAFVIKKNCDITVQINRTVMQFVYRQPWSFKKCCNCWKSRSSKVYCLDASCMTQTEYNDSFSEPNMTNRQFIGNEHEE